MHVLVYNQWNVRGNMRGSGSWCSFAYFEMFRGPLTLSLINGPAKSPEAFGLVLPWRTSDALGSCPFPSMIISLFSLCSAVINRHALDLGRWPKPHAWRGSNNCQVQIGLLLGFLEAHVQLSTQGGTIRFSLFKVGHLPPHTHTLHL